tara:strand:- start:440 stop:1075 length:636 start_codon:yes stop_codon:yes gene_type:complete
MEELSIESNKQRRTRIKAEGAEKLYEDKRWLLVRPFTIEASSLYGGHTKWCTVRHANTTIDKIHVNFFYGYMMSGALYYIIDKTQYARKDKYGKLSIYKDWGSKEIWTDPTDHDLTEQEIVEVKKQINPEFVELITQNWLKLKPAKNKTFVFSPITIIKAYHNRHLARHLATAVVNYDHNIKVKGWLILLYLLLSSPIILVTFLFRKTSKH